MHKKPGVKHFSTRDFLLIVSGSVCQLNFQGDFTIKYQVIRPSQNHWYMSHRKCNFIKKLKLARLSEQSIDCFIDNDFTMECYFKSESTTFRKIVSYALEVVYSVHRKLRIYPLARYDGCTCYAQPVVSFGFYQSQKWTNTSNVWRFLKVAARYLCSLV